MAMYYDILMQAVAMQKQAAHMGMLPPPYFVKEAAEHLLEKQAMLNLVSERWDEMSGLEKQALARALVAAGKGAGRFGKDTLLRAKAGIGHHAHGIAAGARTSLSNAANTVGSAKRQVFDLIRHGAISTRDAVKRGLISAEELAARGWTGTKNLANTTKDLIGRGANATWTGTKNLANTTKDLIGRGANATWTGTKDLANTIANAGKNTIHATGDALGRGARATGAALSKANTGWGHLSNKYPLAMDLGKLAVGGGIGAGIYAASQD